MNIRKTALLSAIIAASLGLGACSSNSNTSTVTTVGRITGFGSVFVNGVEYETSGTTIRKDGQAAINGDADLKVGMIVTVTGSASGNKGVAESIEFNDELEGLVQSNDLASGGSLQVMGQTVTIDTNTNFESSDPNVSLAQDIPVGAIIEVSGYPDGNGNILASYIELKAKDMTSYDDEMEVKGVITNLTDTIDTLSFDLGSVTVDATAIRDIIDLGVPLANDLYVEVKSSNGFDANGNLVASKIELEDDGHYGVKSDSSDKLEVEGLVTSIDIDNRSIVINGQSQSITIPDGVDMSQFTSGDLVEVKISIDANGNPVMQKIEKDDADDDDGDFSIKAIVEAIDPDNATITVDGMLVHVDRFNAIMIDHGDNPDKYFNIDSLAVGDLVEVKVTVDQDGNYTAVKIERESENS